MQADVDRYLNAFLDAGATKIEASILQPADTLLDLYGEDIRGRAYVTHDPILGEMMLRPDFTVPVVQRHMDESAEPARYTYAGPVFRSQEDRREKPREYLQVGYEIFDRDLPSKIEAEVFGTIWDLLSEFPIQASLGDVGLLVAAVNGLTTSEARKAALLRHIWRPHRFRNLLTRYAAAGNLPDVAQDGPMIGLRSAGDISARWELLQKDAETAPIPAGEIDVLHQLLAISGTVYDALDELALIANDYPAIRDAVSAMGTRMDAIEKRGIPVSELTFSAAYGLTAMEYYDGFVFGIYAKTATLPALATGGRYDALTRVLGQGRDVPAVGGVIRPELTERLRA